MHTKAEQALIKGLQAGFAGGESSQTVSRGPFTLTAAEHAFPDGLQYVDQWVAKRTSAGQEIARADGETVSRVYAGGLADIEVLRSLGISDVDVLGYLGVKLRSLSSVTRLHADVTPPPDGSWRYEYKLLKYFPDIPMDIGVEQIYYKYHTVFVHVFVNTPIT